MKRPKHQIQTQNLFSPEELNLLLARENRYKVLQTRNKVAISLLIYQGLRTQELSQVKLNQVDLDNGTIYIRATRTTSSRVLELHRTQILLMDKYIHHFREKLYKGKSTRLLVTKTGVPMSVESIGRMLRPLRALFPSRTLNSNTIRQSVIANWLNIKKYPLGDVQLMAGHKYPSSTERYLAPNNESKRKIINQFHPRG